MAAKRRRKGADVVVLSQNQYEYMVNKIDSMIKLIQTGAGAPKSKSIRGSPPWGGYGGVAGQCVWSRTRRRG